MGAFHFSVNFRCVNFVLLCQIKLDKSIFDDPRVLPCGRNFEISIWNFSPGAPIEFLRASALLRHSTEDGPGSRKGWTVFSLSYYNIGLARRLTPQREGGIL